MTTPNRNGYTTLDAAVSAEVRAEIARTRGLTVSALAVALGVRRATLAARINGQAPFRPAELHALAVELGTTASALVARAEANLEPVTEPAA